MLCRRSILFVLLILKIGRNVLHPQFFTCNVAENSWKFCKLLLEGVYMLEQLTIVEETKDFLMFRLVVLLTLT